MMKKDNFPFHLDGKHKGRCPSCGRQRKFSPYVDSVTGVAVDADSCGKCDRLNNCGYHKSPSEYFKEHPEARIAALSARTKTSRPSVSGRSMAKAKRALLESPGPSRTEPFAPDADDVRATLERDRRANPLYRFMTQLFSSTPGGEEAVDFVFELYHVGTSKRWGGSTIFWFFDDDGRAADGKIMGYDATTGKRIKEPFPHINWVSSVTAKARGLEFESSPKPMFGQHLMQRYQDAQVQVVESEKTALLLAAAAVVVGGPSDLARTFPVAMGGCGGFTGEKTRRLEEYLRRSPRRFYNPHSLTLIPDQGCYRKWSDVGRDLVRSTIVGRVTVSTLLESCPAGMTVSEGDDIGDLVVRACRSSRPSVSLFNVLTSI